MAVEHLPRPLAKSMVLRNYLTDKVKRYEIRNGRLRRTLFFPKEERRFPEIVDMYGGHGGLLEFRAALLASRGFAVLALGFYGFEDLPETFLNIDLEHFIEVVKWLAKHERVCQNGIGYLGGCFGSQIALLVASQCPIIKAVVSISGSNFVVAPVRYKGKILGNKERLDPSKMVRSAKGVILKSAFDCDEIMQTEIEVEKIQGKILLITGEDDHETDAPVRGRKMQERLSKYNRPP